MTETMTTSLMTSAPLAGTPLAGSRLGLRRLLLVQRGEDVAVPLVRALEREGWVVIWVERAADALEHIDRFHVDMVLVGGRVLGADGGDLCREVRRRRYDGGLVLVGDRAPEPAAGVDDHVCQPYALAELQARLRTVQAARAEVPTPR